jgi:hypothetical protein
MSSLVSALNPHDRESAMQTIAKHYIDGAFVESHGHEVIGSINGMRDDPQASCGGFKHWGVGREFDTFGIEAFLQPRAILSDRSCVAERIE